MKQGWWKDILAVMSVFLVVGGIGLAMITITQGKPKAPQAQLGSTNKDYPVTLLFENDGCKVYRFSDDGWHYYTDCRGQTITNVHRGAPIQEVKQENIPTEK